MRKQTGTRIASMLLAGMMMTSLAACGGSAAATTAAAADSKAESKAETAAEATESGSKETKAPDAGSASLPDASGDPQVTFQVTNTHAGAQIQDKTMDMLIELADKYSGGTIKGTKIEAGSLGGEREETEMIQLGTLECGLISDMGIDSAIGGLGWAWLPYMLTDYDQVDQYYINGWIGEELTKQMAAQGIVRVAATENAFRECGNVKKAIKSMDDINGMKIRVPETQAVQDFYTAIGAIPAAIATSETLAALEQGTVDGVDNSISNMDSMGVMERLKYITIMNYMYSGASIVTSEDFWNGMTEAQQACFKQAATEAGAYMRKEMRAATDKILEEGQKNGSFEVFEVEKGSDFYNALKEKAVALWDSYSKQYDASIIEKIKKDFSV